MSGLKEKYIGLRKKYSLPDYKSLNQEFDIEDINSDSELILVKIRIKMYEKIDSYAKLIESMLQPDSNLTSLYEIHYMTDEQKENAYALFKRLVKITRYSNLVSVDNKEDENAQFIKEAYKEWSAIKKDVKNHIKRLVNVWKRETDIKDDLSYFG
jgi:hypothetical protein